MLNINWKTNNAGRGRLYFDHLALNQPFRNASYRSQGAVYIKVEDAEGVQWMYEIQTGKLWPPTESEVEKVSIDLNVPLEKPSIY